MSFNRYSDRRDREDPRDRLPAPPTPEPSSPHRYGKRPIRRGRSREHDSYHYSSERVVDRRSRSPARSYDSGRHHHHHEQPLPSRPDFDRPYDPFVAANSGRSYCRDDRYDASTSHPSNVYVPPVARDVTRRSRRGSRNSRKARVVDHYEPPPRGIDPRVMEQHNRRASCSGQSPGPPNDVKRVKPKNFKPPVTCYYWNEGKCNKSDVDCWYAHYHTGIVAGAPVKLGKDRAIAGRTAEEELSAPERQATREERLNALQDELQSREASLKDRENALTDRFADINARETEVDRIENFTKQGEEELAKALRCFYEVFGRMQKHTGDTRKKLLTERANFTTHFQGSESRVIMTIDSAMDTLIQYDNDVDYVKKFMEKKVGTLGFSRPAGDGVEAAKAALE